MATSRLQFCWGFFFQIESVENGQDPSLWFGYSINILTLLSLVWNILTIESFCLDKNTFMEKLKYKQPVI